MEKVNITVGPVSQVLGLEIELQQALFLVYENSQSTRTTDASTVRKAYFGDSYDVVKQSLLRWLQPFGEWSVHPMFTEDVSQEEVAAFEQMLGAKVICKDVLTPQTSRAAYLSCTSSRGNVFLDPDKGLCLRDQRGKQSPHYLFASELIQLAQQRQTSLTLVFDQSVPRGAEALHLKRKLEFLREYGVFAFAYRSHACFVIAGRKPCLVESVRQHLIAESRLPANRFLSWMESERTCRA